MTLSCIISETQQDIARNFTYHDLFSSQLEVTTLEFYQQFLV